MTTAEARRTVRVFISSTFRDMHAERDHLIKVVFPELRERLDRYDVDFIDIDLRWGITEQQAEDGRVLPLCLQQIDASRPFFVGLLGQRYGWVPEAFPEEAVVEHDWVQREREKSITELEILYGVLNDSRMRDRSFFYFREPAALDSVPDERRRVYIDADPKQQERLERLKQRIRASDLPVYEYSAAWDPETYDRPTKSHGRLGELDNFGEQVLEDLWEAIREELDLQEVPPREATTSPLEREKAYHNRFADNRLVGVSQEVRADLHRALWDYAIGEASDGAVRPLMLVGPARSGKSSALARLAQELQAEIDEERRRDLIVVPHFVGASPRSTSLRETLVRVLGILQTAYGDAIDVLFRGRRHEMNVRAVMIHLAGGTLATLGVIVGALLILFYDVHWVAPAITAAIALYIFVHAYLEIRKSIRLLLDTAPEGFDLDRMVQAVEAVDGVEDLHHVHV